MNLEPKKLIEEFFYYLNTAKIDVNWAKEFVDKNPTYENKEYLRKVKHNLSILDSCAQELKELFIDED